ncbi:protein ELYS-like isoform X4 [Ostrinia furnacalis]|uniref:protein ELYS-like isoform X4 n=1 Tax=Ostrinia furnacalis TaxID=93504 RepID=UPI00103A8424|nr:protein ELYS-like isoform X4 [Ostrinia furnacalis]
MQKLQDSVFSIVKTTNLSPAVFSFLQPTEDNNSDKTPLGGILNDTKHGWLALGPKFCVVDLRTGLKVAARTFGTPYSNSRTTVTSVVELITPLTENSKQLIISLQCEDFTSNICVFHINGSQILRCIQTDLVVTELAVCDDMPDGPFTCFDGVVMAGTKTGEIFAFDLNRSGLIQALKDITQGYEHMIQNESNPANLTFLPLKAIHQIEEQRDLVLVNNDHLAILLNESSVMDGQYIFHNPDGTVRMKAKRDHIRVTVLQYIPQLGSLAVGYNFGAFQIWNLLTLDLEFTSQVNVECLPVTHFGFQEPCDDPRAFCYLWVVFSLIDRFEEEEFPLAVMYSLTYQGKRMLSDTKCLYQDFSMATIRFQAELSAMEDAGHLTGGKCVSCHTYSVNSSLGSEGEDTMLNICQLVWECWGDNANASSQYGMLLFDLDQWYKDQMPATYRLESNVFMSASWCSLAAGACVTLDVRLEPASVAPYAHATRLEEHLYPNSIQYNCICLNTSEACVLSTVGIQRQIISSMDDVGPTALLSPGRLYHACVTAGLAPMYADTSRSPGQEEQRRYLLSVALEARLSRFLKRCAHDWATGSHAGAGCTLPFLVDWCWQRAIELKENARELTAPLFSSSALPDRNVVRCLEHCVQQLTQLTGLLDAILTKCCNLVVPDALSEMEEKYKGIGCVSLYLRVVQWFLRVGLLPERLLARDALPYPAHHLLHTYTKRRMKLQRLEDNSPVENNVSKSCSLLYIDQLIENEFGGERIHEMWLGGGSECNGLYPPPSLYSLLRLYLLPDIAEEQKHSLVLYLLVDYSVVYDDVRHEAVIRRLMQFPTMFGLSNTAIKATQAFWHLDHRDFDFALDQLQCLTGNTLSEWQHSVVLSSLLAQKKTQAALQYLHVRKPAPIQYKDPETMNSSRVGDQDKLDDWQACCSLYLARGLAFEALDVARSCVRSARSTDDQVRVLNYFFRGCRNTGHLSKILQVTLLPLEEEVFIKYLQSCNESQTSDILVMYYLQQARYLEAEQYNSKLRHSKTRAKDATGSAESLADLVDREGARDTIVEVVCASLPNITNVVRDFALLDKDTESHVMAAKPMSVFIQAKSPKNTFTYKSSFIQDTIENASETWINKPKMRRGIKRALNIEETPFICTPKMGRNRSILSDLPSESTPPKRAKLDFGGTPKTPKFSSTIKLSPELSKQMASLLDMPLVQSPDSNLYDRAETPHSILKIRRNEAMERDAPSPVDSRYLGDSDDELLETASNQTHYSDSTNKHLRFTIPTASESGSTPSPVAAPAPYQISRDASTEREMQISETAESERDGDSRGTTGSHAMDDSNPMESPPKKLAVEVKSRKTYKDTVKARRSLSISANSSLSDDPNTSIESIADIPVTLINPRYSGDRRRRERERQDSVRGLIERERELGDRERELGDRERQDSVRGLIGRERELGDRERQDSVRGLIGRERELGDRERQDSVRGLIERERELGDRERQDSVRELIEREHELGDRQRQDSVRGLIERERELGDRQRQDSVRGLIEREHELGERERQDSVRGLIERERELGDSERQDSVRGLIEREREIGDRERQDSVREIEDRERQDSVRELGERDADMREIREGEMAAPKTPTGRRGIRAVSGESTPLINRSRSVTPERQDSPRTPLRTSRVTRSRSRTPEVSPRGSPLAPIIEQPKQEATSEPHAASSTLSVPRNLRSRSRTPERVDKPVMESPRLEAITESPTKSSNSESSPSPSRRSLRSRSRTPEVEIVQEPARPASPRTLRSRPKTPEKLMSPKSEHSTRTKKSLSRIVLEANTFAKMMEKNDPEPTSEESENAIECTPMKTVKQVPSLMDVTLSPIVNKSVLQSSTDSVLSETVDKESNKTVDKSTTDLGLKPLPTFTTIHKTYFEKSVLHSYQSSVGDSSESAIEDKEVKEDNTTNVGLKSLPAFTTINDTGFNKSVLQSYESSVADTSSIHEEKETKITEVSVSKPFSKFTEIVETNFERSVLKSYQSSMAETSNEVSKDESSNKSALKDASLITNDSDVEMKEDECQSKIDSLSAVIQKEKERIVDIEREINELEGDMTDDSSESTASESSGDEEILVPADINEESDDTSESSSESGSGDEEVISIKDTDSDESSSDNKLQIDENTSSSEKQITPLRNIEVVVEVNVESDNKAEEKETVEESNSNVDPMNQAQISMLTDDNSVIESEQSNANLNYSDEVKTSEEPKVAEAVPMDTGELKPAVEIIVMVEEIAPAEIAETDQLDTAVTKSIDAVDSIAPAEKVDPISTTAEAQVKTSEETKVDTADANSTKEKSASIETLEKDKPTEKDDKPIQKEITTQSEEGETEKESHKPAPRTRKRAQSTSSNKSVTETKEEPRTPVTRKRTQSTASNKSVTEPEPKTPENVAEETSTPSRRRAKTPPSVEVRKIITRRASKEMSEKLDESKEALDDSVTATPRRRSTRSRTKNIDDNESVASESSVRSTRSRASEDAGDIKAAPIRKGRKSILSTKPDLSVIPEMIVEEESKSSEDIVNEYSNARRLTRHQKTVLESWLEPAASPRSRRRTSAASRHSASDRDDDDADSTHSFDVQSMDRIALLAKQDFEARLARAGSEAKTTPRAVKKTRSISVDIGEGSEAGSPAGSPLRRASRRASFNKACEALHTPIKGRRTSTDTRKEAESPQDSSAVSESESVATPARRSRRAASTQSNASQTKLDTSKRSKKTSALDESKDKKK